MQQGSNPSLSALVAGKPACILASRVLIIPTSVCSSRGQGGSPGKNLSVWTFSPMSSSSYPGSYCPLIDLGPQVDQEWTRCLGQQHPSCCQATGKTDHGEDRGDPDVLHLITPPLLRAFSYGRWSILVWANVSITVVENTLGGTLSEISILCKVSCQILFLLNVMESQETRQFRITIRQVRRVRPAVPLPLPGVTLVEVTLTPCDSPWRRP